MPRSRKPERYPIEFFELTRAGYQALDGINIPCSTTTEALGLRAKIYAFWAALDEVAKTGGAEALAKRLVAYRKILTIPGESPEELTQVAQDLLAGASELAAVVHAQAPTVVRIERKSENRFAQRIRVALDGGKPTAAESLDRLKSLIGDTK